jgi:hypothetical protein
MGKYVIGSRYYLYCNDMKKVIGKFNGIAANLLLVCFDEVSSWSGAYKSNNRLKSLITQDTTILEKKEIDLLQVPDLANYWFNTNEDWPIKKEATDRRYACFEASDARIGDQVYLDRLCESLTSTTAEHFHRYLMSREGIDTRNPKQIPKSKWSSALREHSIPFWAKMVCGLLDNGIFLADSKTKVLSATIFRITGHS